jgi:RND superfamily putative drug exporter
MSRVWVRALLAALAMLGAVLAVFGPMAGKLPDLESNRSSDYLPRTAESTRTLEAMAPFISPDDVPTVVLYERESGITDRDRARAAEDLAAIRDRGWLDGPSVPPIPSPDGKALQLYLPMDGSDLNGFIDVIEELRALVQRPGRLGLEVHVGGVGGVNADLYGLFKGIDGPLMLATLVIVVLILLVVYRSPVLWLLPVLSALVAYVLASGLLYLLAKGGHVTVNGQSLAILTVLVFGATTDYALLLIARYREELHLHESSWVAMRAAWRGAMPAIVASAATVALGLLCLLASELTGNKGLGPVGAIGVGCAALSTLFLLPALLLLGRGIFWPRVPQVDGEDPVHEGFWSRLGAKVDAKSTRYAVVTLAGLLALTALAPQLDATGVPWLKALPKDADSVVAQERLQEHFPGGFGTPVQVIGPADQLDRLREVVAASPRVSQVVPFTSTPGGTRPDVRDGNVMLITVLTVDGFTHEAGDAVRALRSRVDAVSKDVLVGGSTAIDLDIRAASQRDNKVIIPTVLVLIFLVLCLLLRALVAPLLLIGTVVLSYLGTLGACAVLFNHVFDYPGAESAFPLFAFVFLVALGVDYNIFLMTRVREEAQRLGTRTGMLRGLTVTGGVITSAGVVLAATFATLLFTGLVFAAEMGIAVAFGVLLDTIVVRSLLVPALVLKAGDRVWWPSRTGRSVVEPEGAGEADLAEVPVG